MTQEPIAAANPLDDVGAVEAREADILGQEPRIAPVDRNSEGAEAVIQATARLRAGVVGDGVSLPVNTIPEIMFTLCRYPDIWDKIMSLSLQLQGPSALLPARDRQLAILRTAWLLGAPYEWGEHVRHSKRTGLTSDDIARVVAGSSDPNWNAHERAILSAAEELRANAMVTDATWNELGKSLDGAQLFELLVLIGQFTNVAYFQNSLRLRLEPQNEGLSAR